LNWGIVAAIAAFVVAFGSSVITGRIREGVIAVVVLWGLVGALALAGDADLSDDGFGIVAVGLVFAGLATGAASVGAWLRRRLIARRT
jgi:hypothetical protein